MPAATQQLTLPWPQMPPMLAPGRAGDQAAPTTAEHRPLRVRGILERTALRRSPFTWSIDPYVGCELSCPFCYVPATSALQSARRPDGDLRIVQVKDGAADALRRQLQRRDLHGQPIVIGACSDPYQPAERRFQITRSLLAVLLESEGLEVSIHTRCPLVLRDLALLSEVDRLHAVTVQLSIPTADDELGGRLEPSSPTVGARLDTVRQLAAAGLTTIVAVSPMLPGVNDDEATLRPLLAEAARAGACEVTAAPLQVPLASRAQFLSWLGDEIPWLAPLYRGLFGRRDDLGLVAREQLLEPFRRLRLELGFPRTVPGRG